ncbi:P-loop containing nucleoside triphosphate hydrolase protein [Lentinula lateritia]|nr:P-loop containing nucleoside triphosphate hydrolase protein [Lentinula lateritia]
MRKGGYNSEVTQSLLHKEFSQINKGLIAYRWQINVAEALHLGLDCTVIAGTGAGKTMPFVMPLLIDKDKRIIIISPLNALEEDQASRFKEMGLSSIAVNGDSWNTQAHKDITNGKYNVIVTSPEMALQHDSFRSIISSPTFAQQTLAIIVDEAHCISQWGDKFHPIYEQLAKVPFLAVSATLPPLVLAQVRRAGKSDLDALNFILHADFSIDEITGLIQTMVFFDDISLALSALHHLWALLPSHLQGQIAMYHSHQSSRSKCRIMKEFKDGKIKILLTTEAAGMMLSGEVFLLVQPTVFQEQKKKGPKDNGQATYCKDVEAGFCLWIKTQECL